MKQLVDVSIWCFMQNMKHEAIFQIVALIRELARLWVSGVRWGSHFAVAK